jgi:hypothetical protein
LQNARNAAQEAIFARICAGAEEMDVKWVGVDGMNPGRRSLVTATTLDGPPWSYHMTSAASLNEGQRQKHHNQTQVQNDGLQDWQSELGPFKTRCSATTIESLRDIFSNNYLSRRLKILVNITSKDKRWRTYIHQQETLERTCQEFIWRWHPPTCDCLWSWWL